MKLDATRLRELLDYDPSTGFFTRRVKTSIGNKAGDRAGTINKAGYVQIRVDGRLHYAHRLSWLHVHGEWPAADIDHLSGVRSDNRLENLRAADRQINNQNRRDASRRSQLGQLGVSKSGGQFEARIGVGGQCLRLGRFCSPGAAHDAYLTAKRAMHAGCTI